MMSSTRTFRAVMLGMVASILMGQSRASLAQSGWVEIEPIMKLNGSEIVACGFAMLLKHPNHSFRAVLVNEKDEAGVRTVLRASAQRPPSAEDTKRDSSLLSATVRTNDISTAESLTPQREGDKENFEASGRLSPGDLARLFQQLTVSGADISVRTGTDTYEWKFKGPAAQSVRAAYLMCSGDLYRP